MSIKKYYKISKSHSALSADYIYDDYDQFVKYVTDRYIGKGSWKFIKKWNNKKYIDAKIKRDGYVYLADSDKWNICVEECIMNEPF